ncbi:MAG: hypothetical protein A2297_04880 [Elusimicrobia bacterium RIFOXYB2_FULL_48_7]|nr:MAG: hypothetical protein A2297_04880 [Elusimicrobia bacterium RIFOXYB2_FULL_48_7]
MAMTSRERVRAALEHKEPDRIPIDFGASYTGAPKHIQQKIADILGLKGEPDPRFDYFDDRIQKYFGCDVRGINPVVMPAWGYKWKPAHYAPLQDATIEDIRKYPWPRPDEKMIRGLEEKAKFLHNETDYAVCACQIGEGIFEMGCYMRGYEQWLIDIMTDADLVRTFNDITLKAHLQLADLYYGAVGRYVDMVIIGDDLCTQEGPYMSPAVFRELFKPYFKELVAGIKKHCPGAKLAHHCCGSSWMFLDDFAEIGIDVINPTQTTAKDMAPERLAAKKNKLSFHGGVDLQHILPHGTRQEVEDFVKNLIAKLGPGGGYILAACHAVPDDVKPENVITMLETALKYGKYPIKI